MDDVGVQPGGLARLGGWSGEDGGRTPAPSEPGPARRSAAPALRPSLPADGEVQFFSMFQKNGTGETSTPESSLRQATGWNHCP